MNRCGKMKVVSLLLIDDSQSARCLERKLSHVLLQARFSSYGHGTGRRPLVSTTITVNLNIVTFSQDHLRRVPRCPLSRERLLVVGTTHVPRTRTKNADEHPHWGLLRTCFRPPQTASWCWPDMLAHCHRASTLISQRKRKGSRAGSIRTLTLYIGSR